MVGMAEEKKEIETEDSHILTVFGSETDFDGELEFSDDLIITGKFRGNIKGSGNLEIAKNATCVVKKITAKSIVISGNLVGDIQAVESVEICNGGSVTGDIVANRIRIEDNVNFEGNVTMVKDMPDTDLFSTASAEYKSAFVLHSDTIE